MEGNKGKVPWGLRKNSSGEATATVRHFKINKDMSENFAKSAQDAVLSSALGSTTYRFNQSRVNE